MASYGNFNFNRKRKSKKIIIAVVSIVVILAAAVFFIGITAGSDGEGMERISSVVEENTQLKMEISALNDKIARMQTEIDDLNAELMARPTPEPTPYTAPDDVAPVETPQTIVSPRGSLRQ